MTDHAQPHPEVLRQHGDFVRRVSRQLVRDVHRAEDLEQETWVAAMSRPPDRAEAWGGWLRSAMRNLASKIHRGEQRRQNRERQAAREESVEATNDIVHRLAIQREVVDAVLRLSEPTRTTVVDGATSDSVRRSSR